MNEIRPERTAAKTPSRSLTVAEYAVERLAALGIDHVFGVPGDYAFGWDNAIEASKKVRWIGDANELNAAYAADGYARVRGAAILSTTYAVGELSALCGVMGAYAERLPIFHLVGQPSTKLQRARLPVHHTLGDGVFMQHRQLSLASVCTSTNLTPQNVVAEMERVIAEALAYRRPAYITVAQDFAALPIIGAPVSGIPLAEMKGGPSDASALDAAVSVIAERLSAARSTVVLPAYTIGRFGLQKQLERFLAASGFGYATAPMEKALISETHPQFLGMYNGIESAPGVREAVEAADLVLNLGGVIFSDFNTTAWTDAIKPGRMVTVWPDFVEIGDTTFSPIRLADVLDRLTAIVKRTAAPVVKSPPPAAPLPGAAGDRISSATFYPRLQQFLKENDIVIAETGLCIEGIVPLRFPKGAVYHNQTLWGAIGWATPAALGTSLAAPSRRTVLVTGDGSHQLTANELGAMARYKVKPVIFVLNNSMFGVEEVLSEHQGHEFNTLAPWDYQALPKAMGCTGWYTARITTVGELEAALREASHHDNGCYIEVVLGRADIPPSLSLPKLDRLYRASQRPGSAS